MTLNDLEWPFYVKFCFRASMSNFKARLSEPGYSCTRGKCRKTLNQNKQLRHRAASLLWHGFFISFCTFLRSLMFSNLIFLLQNISCCAEGSTYHLMSAGTAGTSCTVGTNVASTLTVVCSTDVTSPEVDGVANRACAVRWQQLTTSGRYSNLTTSSSGKYSMWTMERPASDSDDDEPDEVVNMLQIASVQREDFTRLVLFLSFLLTG